MEITDISLYKGDTFKLVLDDEETIFVNSGIVADFDLHRGGEIDDEVMSEIKSADTLRKARKRAMYLLAVRDYGYNELVKKLRTSYDEKTAVAAADKMAEYGYVNDSEYAPKLAEYLIHKKHFGMRKTRFEMKSRGLDENLIEDVLSEYTDEEIDEEITELLEHRYYDKIGDYDARRRTIAAFARRGYDYHAVKRCIERLLEEMDTETEENEDFE